MCVLVAAFTSSYFLTYFIDVFVALVSIVFVIVALLRIRLKPVNLSVSVHVHVHDRYMIRQNGKVRYFFKTGIMIRYYHVIG